MTDGNHLARSGSNGVTRGALARGALLLGLASSACRAHEGMPDTELSGDGATVFDDTRDAFSLPSPLLHAEHRASFFVGNSFFNQNWVSAPSSVTSRDGLGPLFNARSCSACHFKDGRSRPPEPGGAMTTMLLRIGVGGRGAHGEPKPDPVYGDQIQGSALPGVPPEADVRVDYETIGGRFADGQPYTLRKPRYRLENLGYGPVAVGLFVSPRVAPAMIGLGLLEAVPESAIRALTDPDDRDRDGISGRANVVWDVVRRTSALGRFGWKAEQPTVRQQSAGAFLGDMGLTSSLFPDENHTGGEEPCRTMPSGGSPEVGDDVLASVATYARSLGVPARRHTRDAAVKRGGELFAIAGCAACHVATLETVPLAEQPELGGQRIHPYTDLLLHDMGEGLADDRPTFEATGREWRTAPLWGLGLVRRVNDHTFFLHDGRARNPAEAILWHAGEASTSRESFAAMKANDREALLAFLESL